MPYGAGGPVTDYKDEVGPGWGKLLDQLHAELAAVDPNYQIVQVKEKFGDLRVYIEASYPDPLWDIIAAYERLSSGVCENCGQPGKHTDTRWIKTLCDPCAENRDSTRRRILAEARARMEARGD